MRRIMWLGVLTGVGLVATAVAQSPAPQSAPGLPPPTLQSTVPGQGQPYGSTGQNPSALATAANIKKDAAEVQARLEAVRYLGTVDYLYWPEAEKALCESLLSDASESVRLEAALALQRRCCSSAAAAKALKDCVSGNGAEQSEAVRAAAKQALALCTANEVASDTDPKRVEETAKLKKVKTTPQEYYKRIEQASQEELIEKARQALAKAGGVDFGASGAAVTVLPAPRPGSVGQILSNAFGPMGSYPTMEATQLSGMAGPSAGAVIPAANTTNFPANQPMVIGSAVVERRPFFDNLTKSLKGKQIGHRTSGQTIVHAPISTMATQPVVPPPMSNGVTQPVVQAPVANVATQAMVPAPASNGATHSVVQVLQETPPVAAPILPMLPPAPTAAHTTAMPPPATTIVPLAAVPETVPQSSTQPAGSLPPLWRPVNLNELPPASPRRAPLGVSGQNMPGNQQP